MSSIPVEQQMGGKLALQDTHRVITRVAIVEVELDRRGRKTQRTRFAHLSHGLNESRSEATSESLAVICRHGAQETFGDIEKRIGGEEG